MDNVSQWQVSVKYGTTSTRLTVRYPYWEVEFGALVFKTRSGQRARAFAPGTWTEVVPA